MLREVCDLGEEREAEAVSNGNVGCGMCACVFCILGY